MIRINQLKLPIEYKEEDLLGRIRSLLKLKEHVPLSYEIRKKSIDSRKKPELNYVLSLDIKTDGEEKLVRQAKNKDIILVKDSPYFIPQAGKERMSGRPVIVGAGPAGLFAAYLLTQKGYRPLLLEQGKPVEERRDDVEAFWKTGILNPDSNVIFGEGGAGTFSDGKLNTAIKDPSGRIRFVLNVFHEFGAPESILYESKPHIGTDVLVSVLVNLRNYLTDRGCTMLFGHRVSGIETENGKLKALLVENLKENKTLRIQTENAVIAPGHGARSTFSFLKDAGLFMEAKTFAVGFRLEHPQSMIDRFAYGDKYAGLLPAAPYKVTSNFPNGRGVYSFCMCPGGYVVNSSSEMGQTLVNGMSYSGRKGSNANSAIIVSLKPEDFGPDPTDPLRGIAFQKELEKRTFERGSGKIPQQLLGDFKAGKLSASYGDYESCTKGQTAFEDLRGILPVEMEDSFLLGMEHFAKIIPGFDRYDAILSGTESRTSSPVRILRDELFESSVKGIYPCGEGAGYAGGITSAAVDGLKVAEALISRFAIPE